MLDQKVDFINSKIEDIEDLNAVFDGYDFCYHLAAGVGVQYIMDNLSESLLTNILATHKVLEVCQDRNIPVLLTSTSEVYGTAEDAVWTEETKSLIGPTSKLRWSYAASKMIDEFMALSLYEEGKVSPIIVRLFNIIGPNQLSKFGMVVPKFIESALNNENIVIHGDGSQSRSFTWVDDVVSYLIKLAEIKAYGEVFNIGQTEEITIKDLAELIIEKTSSTGIRNGLSTSRSGSGIKVSHASIRSTIHLLADSSLGEFNAFNAEPLMIGVSSPGKSYSLSKSRSSISTSSNSSGSST